MEVTEEVEEQEATVPMELMEAMEVRQVIMEAQGAQEEMYFLEMCAQPRELFGLSWASSLQGRCLLSQGRKKRTKTIKEIVLIHFLPLLVTRFISRFPLNIAPQTGLLHRTHRLSCKQSVKGCS